MYVVSSLFSSRRGLLLALGLFGVAVWSVLRVSNYDTTAATRKALSTYNSFVGGSGENVGVVDFMAHAEDETLPEAWSRLYRLLYRRSYKCKKEQAFGGHRAKGAGNDGAWSLCLDFWPLAGKPEDNCVVYDMGVCNEFSFADAMGEEMNCIVRSYDPSMGKDWQKQHWRTPKNMFVPEGVSFKRVEDLKVNLHGEEQHWKLDSVEGFMKRFGDTHLRVLKMDIEFAEWAALRGMINSGLLENVDQIVFEMHFWMSRLENFGEPHDYIEAFNPLWSKTPLNPKDVPWEKRAIMAVQGWVSILADLERAGFRQYYIHRNPYSNAENFDSGMVLSGVITNTFPCCFEASYLKVPVSER